MRRVMILLFVLVGLVGGLLAAPAAAGPPEFPEERIFLVCGDDFDPCIGDFPADTPFFIIHGVGFPHGQGTNLKRAVPAAGHFDFNLFVDDEEVEEDWTFHGWGRTFDVFVFPDGMTGDVRFRGEWIGTCALDEVGVVEGCDKPADAVTFFTNEVAISFVG